ncbi:hypothetical protein CK501_05750 [Halovibrio salipaludis]|uniref:Uncharacterized protein n=1 Tax=Halovibrio salipaludis TaxID=2032626 RepID=A0A2A2F6J4_9GAMM|nr:hypothetical protein [Halovibrio salipaludis]PAU81066.1 hypothetical protein CK501_05750 [Halovibrio salipaludis]
MKQINETDIKRAAPEGTAETLEQLLAQLHEAMQTDAEQTRNRWAEVIEELAHVRKASPFYRWATEKLNRRVIESIWTLEGKQ